jgi:hypothetical protein
LFLKLQWNNVFLNSCVKLVKVVEITFICKVDELFQGRWVKAMLSERSFVLS